MAIDACGIIYTGAGNRRLNELTNSRSVAALPIGGRYRVVDFMLSNLVNSGVTSVGVVIQSNYHSLMDHIGRGKEWDLHRKREGLFLLPPFVSKENTGLYRGTAEALKSVMGYIRRSPQRHCIIMGSSVVFNADLNKLFQAHLEKNADVTFMYDESPYLGSDENFDAVYMQMDETGRIIDLRDSNKYHHTRKRFMNTYIIEKTLLEYLVNECTARNKFNIMNDVFFEKLTELRQFGFRYDGYVARLNDVAAYYRHSMDLLKPEVRAELFTQRPVYTKVHDEVPVMYGDRAEVINSILADGCIINGRVENCVLFRAVSVEKGAALKNCIVMQGSQIQRGCEMENVIMDKMVIVKQNKRLIGQPNLPIIIRKSSII